MDYDAKHYRHFKTRCEQCGRRTKGWLSIPDARKPFYERENHECLECGHVYFRHDREVTPEEAGKLRANLGESYAMAQCPRCSGKVRCYSKRVDTPSKSNLFTSEIHRFCEQCNLWHMESGTQLTLGFVNQQRSAEELPPLPHFPGGTG